MAFLKFATVFCLFLALSAQALAGPAQKGDTISELVEKIVEALAKLADQVLDLANKVLAYIDGDGINTIQADTVALLQKILEDVEKWLNDDISGQPDLDADGLKLYQCVVSDIDNINTALLIYADEVTKCFNPELQKLAGLVVPVVNDLKGVDATVTESAAKLKDCTNDTCILGVLLEILNELLDIPTAISKDTDALVAEWPVFVDKLTSCSKSSGTDMFQKLFKELSVVAKCYSS